MNRLSKLSIFLLLAGTGIGAANAGIFTKAQADELLSKPQVRSVFNSQKQKQEAIEQANINFANQNTSSSGTIFNRRYGTTAPMVTTKQGLSRYEQGSEEAEIQKKGFKRTTPNINNAGTATPTISHGQELTENDVNFALQKQLQATQAELLRTREKLQNLSANSLPMPDGTNAGVPSVPKAVLTGVPKYANSSSNSTPDNKSSELKVTPGVNQIITISTDQPNRIITPFNNPQILSSALQGGKGKECGEVCVKGNVVYISTKKDYPLGLFITEKGNEQTAISLTLVPRRIPPREVSLVLSDSANTLTMTGTEEANVWETSQPFVNTLKKTLLAIALGEVPSGYHLQKIPSKYNLPVCSQEGLKFDFNKGQLMAGVNLNYTIGKVTNVSNKPIELLEASCGGYDVAAVAAYPYNLLEPNQSTEIYVVQRVNSKAKTSVSKRRSLLSE